MKDSNFFPEPAFWLTFLPQFLLDFCKTFPISWLIIFFTRFVPNFCYIIANTWYRQLDSAVKICSSNDSAEANRMYVENRYPKEIICRRPCTSMKVQLTLQDKTKNDENFGNVRFRFRTKVEVTREIYTKTFLMLLAEIGGYLGMTIGVSLLDLKWIGSRLTAKNKVEINICKK